MLLNLLELLTKRQNDPRTASMFLCHIFMLVRSHGCYGNSVETLAQARTSLQKSFCADKICLKTSAYFTQVSPGAKTTSLRHRTRGSGWCSEIGFHNNDQRNNNKNTFHCGNASGLSRGLSQVSRPSKILCFLHCRSWTPRCVPAMIFTRTRAGAGRRDAASRRTEAVSPCWTR